MPDQKILAKLRDTAAVTAACGASASIRGGTLRRSDTKAGVILVRSEERPSNISTGTTTTKMADLEAWCIADRYDDAHDLADAVVTALNGWSSTGSNPDISMVHVTSTTYAPGPLVRGEDKIYEMFIVNLTCNFSG